MREDDPLTRQLRDLAQATEPLPPGLRSALLSDAAAQTAPGGWSWRVWLAGLPAAFAGLWLGLAQPALVLQALPGVSTSETAILEEVFFDLEWGLSQ